LTWNHGFRDGYHVQCVIQVYEFALVYYNLDIRT